MKTFNIGRHPRHLATIVWPYMVSIRTGRDRYWTLILRKPA